MFLSLREVRLQMELLQGVDSFAVTGGGDFHKLLAAGDFISGTNLS